MAKALPKDPVWYAVGGTFVQETEGAILLGVEGNNVWLPKSQTMYNEDSERGDYMEVEVPDWLCEDKGLNDGDGIENKAFANQPAKTDPEPPAPLPPAAYGEDDTVPLELFIDNIYDDMLIVNLTGKYNDKREYQPLEKNDQAFELHIDAVETVDEIKIGAHIKANVNARAAINAGLIEPPRALGKNTNWLKKDTIPHSFDLTDEDKIRLAKQMAEAQGKIANLEMELAETRKSLKAEIDVLQDKLNEAAKIFRSGKSDPVPVKCDVIQDWNTDELVWVSADEEAIELLRRKMTPEEKQPSLFREPPK